MGISGDGRGGKEVRSAPSLEDTPLLPSAGAADVFAGTSAGAASSGPGSAKPFQQAVER